LELKAKLQLRARPNLTGNSMNLKFKTGKEPGKPMQMGKMLLLGGEP